MENMENNLEKKNTHELFQDHTKVEYPKIIELGQNTQIGKIGKIRKIRKIEKIGKIAKIANIRRKKFKMKFEENATKHVDWSGKKA